MVKYLNKIKTKNKVNSLLKVLIVVLFATGTSLMAQTNQTSYKKSYKTSQTKKPTYEVGGTKYVYGEKYKTTGQPKVERSSSARQKFLKSKDYTKVPTGYQVDHIIPLSKGGRDIPSNMQLIPIKQHKQKTAVERKNNSTYKTSTYKDSTPKTKNSTYMTPTYKDSTPKTKNSTYKAPTYNYSKPKTTNSTYKTPTYNYSKPKTTNSTYKTPTYNYSKPKTTNSTYKTPTYNYSTPKSYSTGGGKRK